MMEYMGTLELFTQLLLLFAVQFIYLCKILGRLVKRLICRPSEFPKSMIFFLRSSNDYNKKGRADSFD